MRTVHGKIAPNTHPPPTPKCPEPAHLLVFTSTLAFAVLASTTFQPSLGPPCLRLRKDVLVAVKTVCLCTDTGTGRNVGEGIECRRGAGGRHAELARCSRGVEAESFHDDGVEEGQGVEGF